MGGGPARARGSTSGGGSCAGGLGSRLELNRGEGGGRGAPSNQRILTVYTVPRDSTPGAPSGGSRMVCRTCSTTVCLCVAGCGAERLSRSPRCPAATRACVNHGRCWVGRPLLSLREYVEYGGGGRNLLPPHWRLASVQAVHASA